MHLNTILVAEFPQYFRGTCGFFAERKIRAHHHGPGFERIPNNLEENSSGLSCATATLKLIAKIWSIPWAAANDARCVTVPNNGGIRSGRNTANGCGSKVSNMLGRPNSCALVVAAANNRLCPRCMPSKTPMVTTEPVKILRYFSNPHAKYPRD